MSEPERKVRKTKRTDTISKPEVTVQVAEPVPENKKEEEEDGVKNRTRQLNVDTVPFEFLPQHQKEEILAQARLDELQEQEAQLKEQENNKKARALLGVFIGAGLGMWLAYTVKGRLFSPAVKSVIDTVVDESTPQ